MRINENDEKQTARGYLKTADIQNCFEMSVAAAAGQHLPKFKMYSKIILPYFGRFEAHHIDSVASVQAAIFS